MTDEQPEKLPTSSPDAAAEARAQAEAYDSLFAEQVVHLEDGSELKIPPHPDFGMLDDDEMDAYTELLFERDTLYDREPDVIIPDQKLLNDEGKPTGHVVPGETLRGNLKVPYRIKDKLVKPSWQVKVVRAALGEKKFKELKAGGRNAADVWRIWGKQGLEAKVRQLSDPKSDGSTMDLAAVPPSDSK